jgi:hypothetical protein
MLFLDKSKKSVKIIRVIRKILPNSCEKRLYTEGSYFPY